MVERELDEAERGFSFQVEGPLDMRMDRRQPVSAAQLVNELEARELATIFWELGGERRSRRIARAIVEQRDMQRIETTTQLADTVERTCPRRGARTHPATGVFQALRMAVNDELGQVKAGLDAAWSVLKLGGRLAVITFHSGEDRLVKQFSRRLAKPYTVRGEVDVPELREPREPLLQLHHLTSQPRVIGDDLTFFLQSPLFAVADEAHPRGRVGVAYVRAARRRFLHDGRLRLGSHRGRCPVRPLTRVAVVFVGPTFLAGPRSSHERLDVSKSSFHLIPEPVRFVHDPRVRRRRAFSLCLGVAFIAFGKRSLGGGELDLESFHLR